jgi:methylmalonyl-CoA mutase
MATPNLTLAEFPPVSTAQWEAAVIKDLKGQDYTKRLVWQSDEGIAVKPYYRSEDIAVLPAEGPLAKGAWRILERIDAKDVAAANRAAHKALGNGADDVCFVGAPLTVADVNALIDGLPLALCGIHFVSGERAAEVLPVLAQVLAKRPFRGSLDYTPGASFDSAAVAAIRAAAPDFRPVMVDAARYQDEGSTAVQALGFGLSQAADLVAKYDAGGSLYFSFAAGANYFFEIAKVRAARQAWAQVLEAFGKPAEMVIHSRTSHWTKTLFDPWVNLLRTTTEAMSAALGGSDVVWVEPFDSTYKEADETSLRLARNTQIVLKKEAWLDRVADPAAGSYYLEALTDALAREAWKVFQAAQAGADPEAAVAKSRAAKEAAVGSRRRSVLGTNQYPNRKETMLGRIEREDPRPRAARGFEAIRLRTERNGSAPKFLLLEMGDLKMRKARSGFTSNFFGCAGFEVQIVQAATAEAAVALIVEKGADVAVLCSSDDEYAGIAAGVIGGLRAAGKQTPVVVAGNPKDAEQLTAAGVAEFVHIRTNAAQSLTAWQDKLGVKK